MTVRLESTVGARGQTVIPKPIRDQLALRHGEKVWFRLEADRIIIEREDPHGLLDAFLQESNKRALGKLDWDRMNDERFPARK